MSQLYLVDTTYELFRHYFVMPSRTSPQGIEVGAAYGVLQSVLALLRDEPVTHIGCASDHTFTSFRNELFADYKDGSGVEPELVAQIPIVEAGVAALGLTVWPMVEFEADDAIGTAAHRFADAVDQVVICSPDKDFAQLVDPSGKVVLFDRRRKKRYNADAVREKWGVSPPSIPDYLALVGDTADGIPGIKGWGAKSTAAVLSTYPHIEQIPNDGSSWSVKVRGAKRLAERLAQQRDEALLYKNLATLRLDVPLPETLEQLQVGAPPRDAWLDFAQSYGMERLTERVLE